MKVVMVIDRELPLGLIANTAAVLGASLGKMVAGLVGAETYDADGNRHLGITTMNIPILGASGEQLRTLRDRLFAGDFADVAAVDFNHVAQRSLDYENYTRLLAEIPGAALAYLGLCLYGPVKKVNRLTGSLGLLR